MESVAERLLAAGLVVPRLAAPVANYVPATRTDALVHTSGQLPLTDGELLAEGLLGVDVSVEKARECAVVCALNALAAASTVCELDDVDRVLKLVGYVASSPGFTSQPSVVDAASEVLITAFGDRGRHAREAVGVAELPLGAPVELSLVLTLSE
jgi:enamine deaminase RidA (YjgF/YER057c/UK114 family)